ncbi:MAG: lipid-binding SYLF domain-containing protein [Desulfovibrionaceae bacterium]
MMRTAVMLVGLLAGTLLAACATTNGGGGAVDGASGAEQDLVQRAARAVTDMRAHGGPLFGSMLAEARGVLIVPDLVRAGYIISLAGGDGVLLTRNAADQWSPPAFYRLGRGGWGLQMGVERATMVLLLMDEGVVARTIESGLEFRAAADITVFHDVGRSDVSTLYSDKPVHVFVRSDGAWVGVSLEGGGFQSLASADAAYYGSGATAESILSERRFAAPGAAGLWEALNRAERPQADVPVLGAGGAAQ